MAKYKTLNSASHSLGHSFISLMNYSGDDYVLGHIQNQMKLTGFDKLEIDFLNNTAKPSELLAEPIRISIDGFSKWLPVLLKNLKSDLKLIKESKLIIEFDFSKSRVSSFDTNLSENPYKCVSIIVDDRGQEYRHEFRDWWFPETQKMPTGKTPFYKKLFKNSK
jgi:hypothetical protein